MKIATDHGFPRPSFGGSDPNAFDAFKNERDYIAQGGRMKTTVAAMDWAAAEIERLRAALKGAEIALARDEDVDGAMCYILGAHEQSPT